MLKSIRVMFQNLKQSTRLTCCKQHAGSKRFIFLTPKVLRDKPNEHKSFRSMQERSATDFNAMGYILLVIPATAFGLGTWQVQRRKWKLGLIREMEERTMADPIPFPTDLQSLAALEYRKVIVSGAFDHDREIYMMPRSPVETDKEHFLKTGKTMTGANVVTAFKLADSGLEILVNRGWVPKEKINPKTRENGQVAGDVAFVAVVRHTEKRSPFSAKNDTERNQWYSRDIDTMAATLGTAPVFLDADKKSTVEGGPIGGQTRVTLRNEHLQYIITWYSLSFLTFLMWFKAYWRR